jgi:uncharacterized protein YggT (Ycf19 family)
MATTPQSSRTMHVRAGGWRPVLPVAKLVGALLTLAEVIVALRVIFEVFAVQTSAGFVRFINDITGPMVSPFEMVSPRSVGSTGGTLDIGALISMFVFLIAGIGVAVLLARALPMAARRPRMVAEEPRPRADTDRRTA